MGQTITEKIMGHGAIPNLMAMYMVLIKRKSDVTTAMTTALSVKPACSIRWFCIFESDQSFKEMSLSLVTIC